MDDEVAEFFSLKPSDVTRYRILFRGSMNLEVFSFLSKANFLRAIVLDGRFEYRRFFSVFGDAISSNFLLFCRGLKLYGSLQSIEVVNCYINDAQLDEMLQSIFYIKFRMLERLSLAGNAITVAGVKKIASYLKQPQWQIAELDLSNNPLLTDGVIVILNAVKNNRYLRLLNLNMTGDLKSDWGSEMFALQYHMREIFSPLKNMLLVNTALQVFYFEQTALFAEHHSKVVQAEQNLKLNEVVFAALKHNHSLVSLALPPDALHVRRAMLNQKLAENKALENRRVLKEARWQLLKMNRQANYGGFFCNKSNNAFKPLVRVIEQFAELKTSSALSMEDKSYEMVHGERKGCIVS